MRSEPFLHSGQTRVSILNHMVIEASNSLRNMLCSDDLIISLISDCITEASLLYAGGIGFRSVFDSFFPPCTMALLPPQQVNCEIS